MTTISKTRIESIDLLKGLVMVIMALDHVRDYFHASAYIFDPADPAQSSLPVFFTRWITHFCAPAFSFLAGVSAFLVGKRKTHGELSVFLLTRGLWLIVIEFTVVNFAWFFDIQFRTLPLLVIWSLGISMIVLAALVYLPKKVILVFSCILIFGHNLLDHIHFDSILWGVLHEFTFAKLSDELQIVVAYPLIPWIGVMALGYYFGSFYDRDFVPVERLKIFKITGISAILLFIVLRWINLYGDPLPWKDYGTFSKNLISFLNPSKYPPSLMYLLMTLGGSLMFLAYTEKLRGRVVNFFCTFGRVPFFYYILHLYMIHIVALFFAELSGFGWQKLVSLPTWITVLPSMKGYGFDLWVVYAVWVGIILLLYPLCRKFDKYKQANRGKWWLSYL